MDQQERDQQVCKLGHELVIVGKRLFETSQPDDALVAGAKYLRELADRLEKLAEARM